MGIINIIFYNIAFKAVDIFDIDSCHSIAVCDVVAWVEKPVIISIIYML